MWKQIRWKHLHTNTANISITPTKYKVRAVTYITVRKPNLPLESRKGQNAPKGCEVVKPGSERSPEIPERPAASSKEESARRLVLRYSAWEGPPENRPGEWDGMEAEFQDIRETTH